MNAQERQDRASLAPATLKQDHVREGAPALDSPHLVGLEGGREEGHQCDQGRDSGHLLTSRCRQSVQGACKWTPCQSMTPQHDAALLLCTLTGLRLGWVLQVFL